ncbi:type VI secretion system-associated FHA domain protein TagH [Pseudomonas sp. CCM 7891]|uniref:Type VI secretion system-associated FHA domain protein TagH n=1 Tax=Pseudomonas karstica TaxID=1055468 RepID=A0A7X2RS75_9PSED|nr:type VI secretion system-associated FHA domain protein TagH [Pseudomonas karstica]MTD18985.1 type VI secretion system-associated FHA domain protein TagH [Pseudomonas karstica]
MQLVLEVCDPGRRGAGQSLSKIFDGIGGVIGRGAGCDWIIPDPSRLLSNHHALITYRNGRYFLTDISSNGVFLGGSSKRLPKGKARSVVDGMVVRLGGFEIRACLIGQAKGAELGDGTIATANAIPDDAFLEQDPMQALERELLSRNTSDELDSLKTIAGKSVSWVDECSVETEHLTMPEWVAPVPEATPRLVEIVPATVNEAFWTAFADALGMCLERLDEPGREALAIKAASLLRHSIDGLQQSLHTRNELKSELNLPMTDVRPKGQAPLNDSVDCSEALKILLGTGQLGLLPAEWAIAQAYRDIQAHQVALLAACRAVVRGALMTFAPAHLIRCFKHQEKSARLITSGAHWRAYQRHYQRLIEDDNWSAGLLGGDFAKAYEEQVRLISTLDRAYPG